MGYFDNTDKPTERKNVIDDGIFTDGEEIGNAESSGEDSIAQDLQSGSVEGQSAADEDVQNHPQTLQSKPNQLINEIRQQK